MSNNQSACYFDPATLADPYAFYDLERTHGPVIDVSTPERETYLIVGAEAVKELSKRPELFSSRPVGSVGVNHYPKAEEYLREKGFGRLPHVITMDPPRHSAYRQALAKLLRDKRLHQLRPEIRKVAEDLVDEIAANGRCEFVRDYAWKLSVLVIADLLGVERHRIDDFKRWSDSWVLPLLQPLSEEEMMACMVDVAALQHYLVEQIEDRKVNPRDDLLTDVATGMLTMDGVEKPLRLHEQLAFCEAIIIAGNDSTANALALGMLRLVEFPEVADQIRGDLKLIDRFTEESLRYESAVQSNFRATTEDCEFHGTKMGKGALILVSWGAANRDPEAFENPAEFRLDRNAPKLHLGFGSGPHICAGAVLARQELVESYDLLLRRLHNIRLADGWTVNDVRRSGGIVTHGLAKLPITFDVAPTGDR